VECSNVIGTQSNDVALPKHAAKVQRWFAPAGKNFSIIALKVHGISRKTYRHCVINVISSKTALRESGGIKGIGTLIRRFGDDRQPRVTQHLFDVRQLSRWFFFLLSFNKLYFAYIIYSCPQCLFLSFPNKSLTFVSKSREWVIPTSFVRIYLIDYVNPQKVFPTPS
jgi:hypothetical protein